MRVKSVTMKEEDSDMAHLLSKVECSSMYCPLIVGVGNGDISPDALHIPRSEARQDRCGNYWCTLCQIRHDLMNWGYIRSFPLIQVPPYAIGPGEALWHTALALGLATMIDTLAASLLGTTEESEVV